MSQRNSGSKWGAWQKAKHQNMNFTRIVAVGYRNTSCQVLIELHRNMLTSQKKNIVSGRHSHRQRQRHGLLFGEGFVISVGWRWRFPNEPLSIDVNLFYDYCWSPYDQYPPKIIKNHDNMECHHHHHHYYHYHDYLEKRFVSGMRKGIWKPHVVECGIHL